jgi:zinc protease
MVIIDKPGAPQTAVVMAAPGVAQSDPDYEALLVANRIFGGSFSSRLNEDLRETRGYTYGAYSSVAALRGAGLVSITMDVETPSTADAVQETFSELDRLAASGVTADELTRAKQWMTESLPANFATRAKTLGTLRTLYLGDLPPDYFRSRPARLAAISADDVGAVARRRFRPGAFTVVAVGERSAIEAPLRTLGLGPVAVGSPE